MVVALPAACKTISAIVIKQTNGNISVEERRGHIDTTSNAKSSKREDKWESRRDRNCVRAVCWNDLRKARASDCVRALGQQKRS